MPVTVSYDVSTWQRYRSGKETDAYGRVVPASLNVMFYNGALVSEEKANEFRTSDLKLLLLLRFERQLIDGEK